MSEMWLDTADAEAMDLFGGESAEDYFGDAEDFDTEGYDDAEAMSVAERRRRARAQYARRQLARRRAALARARGRRMDSARPRPPATTGAAVRQTRAAVQELGLESSVQVNALRSAIAAQGKRTTRAEASSVASAAVGQFQSSFPQLVTNPFAKAALSFAPLLLLSPARREGVAAVALDPRVYGGVGIAGLAVAAHFLDGSRGIRRTEIAPPTLPITAGGAAVPFVAVVRDLKGNVVPGQIYWVSTKPNVATVDPKSGMVTPLIKGDTTILATASGAAVFDSVDVKVT